ncbi:MAG: uracil phosphoribosyltransferase [Flavobacteriaceae bacterium]|nr:uracil phosphoribosyltransferase [Flavobacteriaceae bacterium]
MDVHVISKHDSILNTYLYELRNQELQKNRMRFRKNIERMTQILCYEMSKSLVYKSKAVKTELGNTFIDLPVQDLVICSVLRAGLSMHHMALDYFDQADNAFISAYRKHDPGDHSKFEIIIEYLACPDLNNKTLLLIDPMLASGKSLTMAYQALQHYGEPKQIRIISLIAAQAGVDYVDANFPEHAELWLAALDPELNDYGYIVPGLGDAGDLAFGEKLQH